MVPGAKERTGERCLKNCKELEVAQKNRRTGEMFEELQRIKKRTGVMFETHIEFDGPETKKYMKSCKELDMIWGKRKNR